MSSNAPRSIRFESPVEARLSAFLAQHPGTSWSAATNRFVDEALRMEAHSGIVFRDGPTGRRAVLANGPDVREVVRAVTSARRAEPDLGADAVVELVSANTGVPTDSIELAIRYWASFPDEIDAWIAAEDDRELEALEAWGRRQRLLSS